MGLRKIKSQIVYPRQTRAKMIIKVGTPQGLPHMGHGGKTCKYVSATIIAENK